MTPIAITPEPPYIAVIFTNIYIATPNDGYAQTADAMVELAAQQDGYLGIESVRDGDGTGITVSYWRDEESIVKWKAVAEHQAAQKAGMKKWYKTYTTRIATVSRAYSMLAKS